MQIHCLFHCRWRIIIHGCIDGFSRRIVNLKATDNNRAETVLQLFVEAVDRLGLPSRVRSDRGGGNVGIARFMLALAVVAILQDDQCIISGLRGFGMTFFSPV